MWQIKAVFGVAVLGALVATDFVAGNNARPEGEKLSFAAYLGEWSSMAAAVVPTAPVMDAALAAALPVAPAGWTRTPAAAGDVAGMLVRRRGTSCRVAGVSRALTCGGWRQWGSRARPDWRRRPSPMMTGATAWWSRWCAILTP